MLQFFVLTQVFITIIASGRLVLHAGLQTPFYRAGSSPFHAKLVVGLWYYPWARAGAQNRQPPWNRVEKCDLS
jgi:hypothetical protein